MSSSWRRSSSTPVFDRQAWAGNPEHEKTLKGDKLAYFRIMRGPWDRQAEFEPFAIDKKRPEGGGFYPEDLTAEEFKKNKSEELESLYTVVERKDGKLVAVPYSEAFGEWLKPAAEHLKTAAGLTKNKSLAKFLKSRAKAFGSDDYYQSDKDWMDLDSRVEITIGPYETYEDHLLGLKASFEAFVTVSDPAESEKLEKYKKYLPQMEQHLPVENHVKTQRGSESPIRVVDLVFSSGDARKSVQTIAFNLPNDERVRKEKGAKKVLLRNSIQTKFEKIMKPIGEKVLDPKHHEQLSGEAFFNQVLFHELSHSLGPAFVTVDGNKEEIRKVLGPAYTALEECKADVMGAYNILFMIEKGELPKDMQDKVLASYFGGLFRSVRFGVAEAHGRGAAVQINRFLDEGAVDYAGDTQTFSIDFGQLRAAIEHLVRDLVMIQHRANPDEANAFLDKWGRMTKPMQSALAKLDAIPVDLRPIYPLAGETGPR